LEANPEATEAIVEQQELFKKEMNFGNIGHWRTDMEIDVWLCGVVDE
jgi:hypothetical protein